MHACMHRPLAMYARLHACRWPKTSNVMAGASGAYVPCMLSNQARACSIVHSSSPEARQNTGQLAAPAQEDTGRAPAGRRVARLDGVRRPSRARTAAYMRTNRARLSGVVASGAADGLTPEATPSSSPHARAWPAPFVAVRRGRPGVLPRGPSPSRGGHHATLAQ